MTTPTYYIPKIEDIHLGLAIEHWQVNMNFHSDPLDANSYYTEKWVKCLVTKENIKDAIEYVLMEKENEIPTCIRVKHLDREDIEGEGWDEDWDAEGRYLLGGKFIMFKFGETNIYAIKKTRVFEKHGIRFCEHDTIFEGEILNLTEFRKLMKQLGIKK